MRQAVGIAAVGVASLALAYPVSHHTTYEPVPVSDYPPMTDQEAAAVNDSFQQFQRYWKAHHAGIASTRLVLLRDQESTDCFTVKHIEVSASKTNGAEYCSGSNEVIMTDSYVSAINELHTAEPELDPLAVIRITVGHELGHAIEDAQGRDMMPETYAQAQMLERGADCYSGVVISATLPPVDSAAEAFYTLPFASDQIHGPGTERLASFESGTHGGPC